MDSIIQEAIDHAMDIMFSTGLEKVGKARVEVALESIKRMLCEEDGLIAAAPDLLALVEAVEWIKTGYTGMGWDWTCVWACSGNRLMGHAPGCRRQAALAKAKGADTQ